MARRNRRKDIILISVTLVGAGLALRLYQLDARSLWLDEAMSLRVARHPLELILTGQVFDNDTPPLYYLLLHLWLAVAPATVEGIRLLSVLIDSLNVLLIGILFSIAHGRRLGWSTAGLSRFYPTGNGLTVYRLDTGFVEVQPSFGAEQQPGPTQKDARRTSP